MGTVVRLDVRRRHGRASQLTSAKVTRACIEASASKVTPAMFLDSANPTSETQYSGGILPRCAHLLTAEAETSKKPATRKSSDIASKEGQRASRVRGESDMFESLGLIVLNVKANLSYDCEQRVSQTAFMADRMSETEEKLAFIRRVRAAREARFDTQKPMLTILDIEQGTYKQYETRTPLPYRYIPKFCAATGVEIDWLLTGEGKGPAVQPLPSRRSRDAKQKKPIRKQDAA